METCVKVRVTCCYEDNGCKEVFGRSDLRQHLLICQFKPVTCEGCKKKCLLQAITQHYAKCEYIKVECLNCGVFIERKDLQKHNCFQDLLKFLNVSSRKFWEHKMDFKAFFDSL